MVFCAGKSEEEGVKRSTAAKPPDSSLLSSLFSLPYLFYSVVS